MGLFRVRNERVMAVLFGIAVVLDLVELCIAVNSRFQRHRTNNPSNGEMERKITIKMPGTHPLKVNRLDILTLPNLRVLRVVL